MRLSKIKLAGFKSFVDPTTLDLVSNMTAIVGPNGCGKSNIIDAIRWVMGESSTKKLRADASTDVIFNGSSSRKPIGQASVELVFDNSDGTLGGEYARFSEIAIKRAVTRDGQSNYYINGQRARRKDITDIFLGTGLGPRSYAIIEQGMISRVIEAKPEDMRNFIEEAAGISKYKERRRETENRIKHTQDNLNRLNDIRLELEKQLENLEKQAVSARKYQELKQENKIIECELAAMSWQRLDKEIQLKESAIRDFATDIEKHYAAVSHLRAELEEVRENQNERNEHLNEVQRQYYSIGSEITKFEQNIENIAEQLKTLQESQIEEAKTLEHAQVSLLQDKSKITTLEAQIAEWEPITETLMHQIDNLSEHVDEQEMHLESWRDKNHQIQQSNHQITQAAEREKTNIEHLENQVQQSDVRYEKLKSELLTLQQVKNNFSIASQESEFVNIQLKQTQLSEKLNEKRIQQSTLKNQLSDLKSNVKIKEKSRQKIKDELTTLQAIQAVRLGKENQDMNAWMEEKGLSANQRLAEVIQVEPRWQTAVETLLASQLDAVYLEQGTLFNYLNDFETADGVGMVMQDEHQRTIESRSVLSKISNPNVISQGLKNQLNHIWFVEDVQTGFELLSMHEHISVITEKGIWLGQGFIKIPVQKKEKQTSILEMTQQIKLLSEEYAQMDEQFQEMLKLIEQLEFSLHDLSQIISDETDELTNLKQKSFNLQSEIKIKKNKIEQSQQRIIQIENEMSEIERSIQTANASISISREKLQSNLDEMATINETMDDHANEKSSLEEIRLQLKQSLQSKKDEHHQLALTLQAAKSEFKALTQNIQRFDEQILNSQERLKRIEQSICAVIEPESQIRENLEQALNRRLEAEELLHQARDDMHAGENKIKMIEATMQQEQDSIERIRIELEKNKMDWQALKVHMETVLEKITQKEIDVQAVLNALSAEANEAEWQARVEKIERQIARLGAINLAAIEECSSAQERKGYLDQQYNDLTEALLTLDNAIKKIDKETKDRFKETFDKINTGFQSLFPRLFGGGESSIILTGDDMLNTGVTVMARPPGKKNASIQLLSGGEKALTAVAFVFSIFLLNPAPFCLLDEVDAPLDDNNVVRFCRLVKEMSENVQFIFISHNKIAIAMGQQLHGVTMREAGVSRLVSVDVDEAVQLVG